MQYHHKKKLVPPPKEIPRLLPLPSPSISPQGSQPISQPLPLAILRKAPDLSPKRRGPLPYLASICTKRKLPYTLQHQSPPIPYRSRVHRLFPLTKERIHLLQRPTPKPHKFPSRWSTPKRTKRAKKAPTSPPADKCSLSLSTSSPFTSLFQALLQHPQKQPYGRSPKKPTVGRQGDPR